MLSRATTALSPFFSLGAPPSASASCRCARRRRAAWSLCSCSLLSTETIEAPGNCGSIAYVSIRPHTSAYVRFRLRLSRRLETAVASLVSIRQHVSACVSMCQHVSACVSMRLHTSAYVCTRQHTSAYVSIRQHTSAYVSIRVARETVCGVGTRGCRHTATAI